MLNFFLKLFFVVSFLCTKNLMAESDIPIIAELIAPAPKMAIDEEGNMLAVWKEMDNQKHTNIQSKVLSKDGIWSPTSIVSTSPSKYYKDDPQVVVDAAGNAVAVWVEYKETGLEIPPKGSIVKAAIFSKGIWSAPKDLSAQYGRGFFPQIAINRSGFGVIVWQQDKKGKTGAKAITFHTSGNWSNPVDISSLDSQISLTKVAVDDFGNAVVIMADMTSNMVQATSLPLAGSWTSLKNLSELSRYGSQANLDMDANGHAIAVWGHLDGENYSLQSSTLEFGKEWSTPVDITPKGTLTYSLEVAVNAKNKGIKGIAVWSEKVEAQSRESYILYSSYLTEFGWNPQLQLSENNLSEDCAFPFGQRALSPAATFDNSGNALIVWGYEDDFGARFIQAAALDEYNNYFFNLSEYFETCYYPQIAVRPDDEALVTWLNTTQGIVQAAKWRPCPNIK